MKSIGKLCYYWCYHNSSHYLLPGVQAEGVCEAEEEDAEREERCAVAEGVVHLSALADDAGGERLEHRVALASRPRHRGGQAGRMGKRLTSIHVSPSLINSVLATSIRGTKTQF